MKLDKCYSMGIFSICRLALQECIDEITIMIIPLDVSPLATGMVRTRQRLALAGLERFINSIGAQVMVNSIYVRQINSSGT